MADSSITAIEQALGAAGHQVDRTFEDGPDPRKAFSDAESVFRVDGEVATTGHALGPLEECVRASLGSADRLT